MLAPEGFRSLAQLLRGADAEPHEPRAIVQVPDPVVESYSQAVPDVEALMRDIRLFRAHIAEAVDARVERLIDEIARRVLARELELAPCEIEAIVDSCLSTLADGRDIHVFVHPDDAERITVTPVETDASLQRGDCVVRLESGSIRSTLQLRLREAMTAGLQ